MLRKLFAAAALAVPFLAVPQARAFDTARGLLASYPLDGDASDEVSRSQAQVFGTRPADGHDGRRSGALWFDGTRSYVNLGDRLGPARFTVSAWVKPDALGTTQVIVSRIKNTSGHLQKNLELRLEADGTLFLHVPSGLAWESLQGSRPIPAGRWTHVAATYDGARAMLFVDGVRDGDTLQVAYAQSRTETYIGARPDGGRRSPTFYFGGAIDDVRIWDRALSEGELTVVSGRAPPAEPPRVIPAPGREGELVAHYPLDRGEFRDAAGSADGRPSAPIRAAEDRRGNPAGAVALGGREYVDLGAQAEPEQFTLAAWVRLARVDREMVIFSKLSTAFGPRDRWLELRVERGGRVVLELPYAGARVTVFRTVRPLAPGRWAHVAATFDGERAVLYLDGQMEGETLMAAFEASRGPAFLGARPDGGGRRGRLGTFLEGRLDEVRVYRGALPAAAVAVLAERAPPVPVPSPGPGRPGHGDDEEASTELLVRVGQALVRFDAAVARRDPSRVGQAEERALQALEQGADELRGDRTAGPLVQRIRHTAQELRDLRGRYDALSLDRKRSALASLADTLWNDLAQDLDERPL
jgi:hypothetical protein